MSFVHWWRSGDAVTQTAALVLLLGLLATLNLPRQWQAG